MKCQEVQFTEAEYEYMRRSLLAMDDDTPPLDIDALDALYAATTVGEWRVVDDDDGPGGSRWVWVYGSKETPIILDYMKQGDGEWCAAIRNAWPALRARLDQAEAERDTLRAHLAAIDAPETILYDEDHPNGLTPAMRALRQAIAQRDVQRRMNQKLLRRNTTIREERDQAREQCYCCSQGCQPGCACNREENDE